MKGRPGMRDERYRQRGDNTSEVDMHRLRASKWNPDVAGHYARPDAFELSVRKQTHLHKRRSLNLFGEFGEQGVMIR